MKLTFICFPEKLGTTTLAAFLQKGREEVEIRWSGIEFVHLPYHRPLKFKSIHTPSIYIFLTTVF